jgi:hypothetical protein
MPSQTEDITTVQSLTLPRGSNTAQLRPCARINGRTRYFPHWEFISPTVDTRAIAR